MRVRISYGVELEEVPSKIQDLAQDSIESMQKSIEYLKMTIADLENVEHNSEIILDSIDKIRRQLSNIDLTIADCQSIMVGINNFYNGEQNVSEGRPIMDPSGDTITPAEDTGEG